MPLSIARAFVRSLCGAESRSTSSAYRITLRSCSGACVQPNTRQPCHHIHPSSLPHTTTSSSWSSRYAVYLANSTHALMHREGHAIVPDTGRGSLCHLSSRDVRTRTFTPRTGNLVGCRGTGNQRQAPGRVSRKLYAVQLSRVSPSSYLSRTRDTGFFLLAMISLSLFPIIRKELGHLPVLQEKLMGGLLIPLAIADVSSPHQPTRLRRTMH